MVLLMRNHQVVSRIEDFEGTGVVLVTAGALQGTAKAHLALSAAPSVNRNISDRNEARAGLSQSAQVVGRASTNVRFGVDLRGSGTPSTAPDWDMLIRACGMRRDTTGFGYTVLTIGAITGGPFVAGETVTQAVSGATGRVLVLTRTGTTAIWVALLTATAFNATGLLTGGTSGATATPTAFNATGVFYKTDSVTASTLNTTGNWATANAINGEIFTGGTSGAKAVLRFASTYAVGQAPGTIYVEKVLGMGNFATVETITGATSTASIGLTASPGESQSWTPSLTLHSNIDGFIRRIVGARGNATLNLVAGEPARVDFDFTGAADAETDQAGVTAPVYPSSAYLRFATAIINLDGYEFPIGSVDINLGNSVGLRPNPGAESGNWSAVVTAREPRITFDPDMVLAGAFDFYAKQKAATTASMFIPLGSVAGNRLDILIPKLQFDTLADGDRDGVWSKQITARAISLTSTTDDELYIMQT